MDPPLRAPGGWDVVLCRNVFIYFSQQNASRCAEALSKVLNPDGTLFWGAGELMTQTPVGIYPVSIRERIAFRRIQTGVQPKGESSKPVRPLTAPTHLASPLVWGEQSPQKHPRDAPASTDWEELLAREDIASATQEVLRLSAEMPLDPTLRTAAGVFLYSSGDYDRALREFRASLVLDSRLWFAALYEGLCLDGLGRREEALACYQAAERSLVSTNNSVALPEALKGHGAELRDMLKAKTRTANSS
jgi:chemotaxis protein methyltransferase CheR